MMIIKHRFFLILTLLTIIVFYAIGKYFLQPTKDKIAGKYFLQKKDVKTEYFIVLQKDGNFEAYLPTDIKLCKKGIFELVYSNQGNELEFKCEKGYYLSSINNFWGFYSIELQEPYALQKVN